jgi:uncharacterized protein with GYD domain
MRAPKSFGPLPLPHTREATTIRLVTRGRFSHAGVKALVDAPEDREPAVRKLIEEAGGKVISFYMTTGDTDFLLISEANEAEAVIAAVMAASAAGIISNVAKSVADRAAKAVKATCGKHP